MVAQALSVVAFVLLCLLGIYMGVTNTEASSVRFGWTMAIIGFILAALMSIELIRAWSRGKKKRRGGDH